VIIKLTNVSAKHKGKILLLNPKYIMAVFEDTIDELWLKLKRDET